MAMSETVRYRADKFSAEARTSPIRPKRRPGGVRSWLLRFPPNGRLGRFNGMVAGIGMSVIALGLLAWTAVSGYLDVRTDAANLGTMMAAAVRGDLKDDPAAAARL